MAAVMVDEGLEVRRRELAERREREEAANSLWRAENAIRRAEEAAAARALLSSKQHVRARKLGEERLVELRRMMFELEPHLAQVERRLKALRRFEAGIYGEFTGRYGEEAGEQAFVDFIGHGVVAEAWERLEKAVDQ